MKARTLILTAEIVTEAPLAEINKSGRLHVSIYGSGTQMSVQQHKFSAAQQAPKKAPRGRRMR